jgi:hypothetical protein
MITVQLKEGISHKSCNQCQYETTNADKMLSHLNEHRLEELIALKSNKPTSSRYAGITNHKCLYCNFQTTDFQRYRFHLHEHDGVKRK